MLKKKVDGAQSKLDEATPAMNEATNKLTTAKANQKKDSADFNTAKDGAYSYVNGEITTNKAAIEEAKKELETLKTEKERLEKEAADSETKKSELEADYKKAEKEYNELISQNTVEDLTNKIIVQEKAVEAAASALKEAQSKYNDVKGEYDTVTSQISELEAKVSEQQKTVEALNEQLKADEAAKNEALAALNKAQEAYDAATDENVKKDLETQLTNAQNTLNSATTAYDNVNVELTAEQSKLTKLKDDVTNAQKDSQNAIDAYKNAQTALDTANKEKNKADETLSSLQQQLADTKTAITKAEENVTSKKAALDALKGTKENLEKLVESTKAAYDAVQAQWNQGSLGYYESIGDTQAVDVIKEGMQLGTTDLNNEMAATSLDNMKKSLGMLDECNRLRKLNGLSELKTSGLMNAISQVKLNHTEYRQGSYDSPHTHLYGTSENLAAGYNWDVSGSDAENKGKGPFRGWYGHEKDVLDEFYKEHPEEVGTDPWELITRYDGLFNQIGHYLILLNTGSTVTGVSYLQRGEYDKEYGTGGVRSTISL